MSEYLRFRRMIAPIVIEVLFWIGVVACIIAGIAQLGSSPLGGLAIILLGPLVVRIYAELLMVIFKINEALQDMRGDGGRTAASHPAASTASALPSTT